MSRPVAARRQPAIVAPGVKAWRNAIFAIFAACGVSLASLAARIPAISVALHLSTAQVGFLLFGAAVGSIVGLVAAGHLVATFGSKRVILILLPTAALALTGAAIGVTILMSFSATFVALIVFGACLGTCDVAMNVSGAANERALGRSMMPIYHAFFSIGTVIGAGWGAVAQALELPLPIHIAILAAVMIATTVIATRFLLPEIDPGTPEEPHQPTTWRERLSIWRDPRTILIGLIVLGFAFTEGSSNDWTSYAMVNGHHSTKTVGAIVYGVFVVAMTIGRFGGVLLIDRFGRVPVLRATFVCAVIGLLLFIFVPIFWIDVVGIVLWGLGASLGFPIGMSAAADDPRKAAARVSAVATIGYCAFLVGPPLIGFLGNQVGILHALLLVLLLVGLAGAVSGAARQTPSERATPSERQPQQ
ncbi:MAG TPA: MFS transporter [Galbitalea sp.]|jgi:MFS family permease